MGVDKEEFKKFKEKHEGSTEEEFTLKVEGKVLVLEDGRIAGASINTSLVGRSNALVEALCGVMEEEESFKEIILEASKRFVLKELSTMVMKEAMDSDEDIELEEMDIPKDAKDKLNLSKLFNGLKPKIEC